MPWTFAHPAAVLPLRRFCPAHLSFAGLVAGSLAPDIGYYTGSVELADFAHTFPGTLAVALPFGIAALAIGHLARRPFAMLLPQPHRRLLLGLPEPGPAGARTLAIAAASVLLGAWTHVAWDAFTHHHRFFVTHLEILQARLFRFDGRVIHVDELLQHLSTLVGTACVVVAYLHALRRVRERAEAGDRRTDRARLALLAILALIAAAWGAWVAMDTPASIVRSRLTIALVRGVIQATTGFALLLGFATAVVAVREAIARRRNRA